MSNGTGGRPERTPQLDATMFNVTRHWSGPLRSAAIDYAITKASGGSISADVRSRIAKDLGDALDPDAGGTAVPGDVRRSYPELQNKTPIGAMQNVFPEVEKIRASMDERFATKVLRLFFIIPRSVLPANIQWRVTRDRAFLSVVRLMGRIPPGRLPIRRTIIGSQGFFYKSLDRTELTRLAGLPATHPDRRGIDYQAIVDQLAEVTRTLGSRLTPDRQNTLDILLARYDGGARTKSMIKSIQKKAGGIRAGKPAPDSDEEAHAELERMLEGEAGEPPLPTPSQPPRAPEAGANPDQPMSAEELAEVQRRLRDLQR